MYKFKDRKVRKCLSKYDRYDKKLNENPGFLRGIFGKI